MPHIDVYIHYVWTTKNREPYLLNKEFRHSVWKHIQSNAELKQIRVDCINGWVDHCHCLVSMGLHHTLGDIPGLLKGESSFWVNKNKLCPFKFGWQDEYYAVSVSPSDVPNVMGYIRDQEAHHRHMTFQQECEEFFRWYGPLRG